MSPDPPTGYIVHLIRGKDNPTEAECFRRICMRHGLQAWDVMHQYLPWRSRADLRSTLCKTIRKQALSEYQDINADPLAIRQDNERAMASGGVHPDYIVKNGLLVNQKWDRDAPDRARVRARNAERYDMDDRDSLAVEIPYVMSVEYLQHKVRMRNVSLQLYRAALLAEKARRAGKNPPKIRVNNCRIHHGRAVFAAGPVVPLKYAYDTTKYMWDS
jgi:hypothetical protein